MRCKTVPRLDAQPPDYFSSSTHSCCASRSVSTRLSPRRPTTSSNPLMPGTIVMKEVVPSGLVREPTALGNSPKNDLDCARICPSAHLPRACHRTASRGACAGKRCGSSIRFGETMEPWHSPNSGRGQLRYVAAVDCGLTAKSASRFSRRHDGACGEPAHWVQRPLGGAKPPHLLVGPVTSSRGTLPDGPS